jgi:hypothetical protein
MLTENELFMRKKNTMKESKTADVNGTKIFIENGDVKTILSEQIQKTGYMTLEESFQIGVEQIRKVYEIAECDTTT